MRPILPWNVPTGGRCAQAHAVQEKPDAVTERPFPHLLQNSCAHPTSHCNSRDFSRDASSQRSALVRIIQALQSFVQGYDWVFDVLFPLLQSCLVPSQNVTFASWIIAPLLPVLGCLPGHRVFAF